MNNLDEAIFNIQDIALEATGASCINKDISYQQAWSILLRSQQLQKEAKDRPIITPEEKVRQIEVCWRKRTHNRNHRR